MRPPGGMPPVHPGEILADAGHLAVPTNRITAILNGQRGVTADTALRLARYFGTTPEFWLNLQKTYELRAAEIESGDEINAQVQPRV